MKRAIIVALLLVLMGCDSNRSEGSCRSSCEKQDMTLYKFVHQEDFDTPNSCWCMPEDGGAAIKVW